MVRKKKSIWLSFYAAIPFALLMASCAPAPKIIKHAAIVKTDTSAEEIANIRSLLAAQSRMARSLSVTGDVTLEQNGDENSASFTMKSKRIDEDGNRIDSLSILITGPFGIKVARFLASPEQYEFYDLLHDQTLTGATDAKSLEDITRLQGVSLQEMSDLIYGLPGALQPDDSIQYFTNTQSQIVFVIPNRRGNSTSMLEFDGTLPSDSSAGNLTLAGVQRWNGVLDPMTTSMPPILSVRFLEPVMVNGVSIPQRIEASTAANKLTLTYDHIELNPQSLTVKIKMPTP